MDPGIRDAILIGGLIFVGLFAAMTVSVVLEDGINVLTVAAGVIVRVAGAPADRLSAQPAEVG